MTVRTRSQLPSSAVVHEWLDSRAGSEKVFERLAALIPTAQLFALSREPGVHFELSGRSVRLTALNTTFLRRHRALALPLMPLAWRAVRGNYDLVITSHHAFAKGARLAKKAHHISYVHTPARYLWESQIDQRGGGSGRAVIARPLRWVDRRDVEGVDVFVANSGAVRERILRHWNRDAEVVYPPVDVDFYRPADHVTPIHERTHLLGVSRFVEYKRLDLVIGLGERLGFPVILAGHGPWESHLRERAAASTTSVRIVTSPADEVLRALYRSAICLVYPAYEDFGIVPVEAQACGTPVVALDSGGTAETVLDGASGALVAQPTPDRLEVGVRRAIGCDPMAARANAERFATSVFDAKMSAIIRRSGFGELLQAD